LRKELFKDAEASLNELSESANETLKLMKDFTKEVKLTKGLWRESSKPWLIKAGIALLAFPEPFVSDILGSLLIAVGLLKVKMQRSTLYMEDLGKTFPMVLKNLETFREEVNVLF